MFFQKVNENGCGLLRPMAFLWHKLSAVHSQGTLLLRERQLMEGAFLLQDWDCCSQNAFRVIKKTEAEDTFASWDLFPGKRYYALRDSSVPFLHRRLCDAAIPVEFFSKAGTENATVLFGLVEDVGSGISWSGSGLEGLALPSTSYVILSTFISLRLMSSSAKWG